MDIWKRLGSVVKSYLRDERVELPWKSSKPHHSPGGRGDPDFEAAYEELEEFLKNDNENSGGGDSGKRAGKTPPIPEEVRKDFAELGLLPGASEAECKTAYKRLLKAHHPDRHGKSPADLKKATETSARLNAAYTRLENWFRLSR